MEEYEEIMEWNSVADVVEFMRSKKDNLKMLKEKADNANERDLASLLSALFEAFVRNAEELGY